MENRHARTIDMNATCCPNQNTLEAYLLGSLTDDAIDAHLDGCAGCQAALDQLDAAVNRPFACLRAPAAPDGDWQAPAQLLVKVKEMQPAAVESHEPGRRLPYQLGLPFQLGDYLL